MFKRYVLTNPKNGIFIGIGMGLAFWSRLDAANQWHVATLLSVEQAREYANMCSMPGEICSVQEVMCASEAFATIEELEAAGLVAYTLELKQNRLLAMPVAGTA